MADRAASEITLLRWSKHLPASDVQDPLGLSLRGSARIGASLLYCITSITPRARYFSFVPWCIHDFQRSEKGKPYATGLDEAIVLREHALTLGCVAHHGGKPCNGGSLVGSEKATSWFTQHKDGEADFRRLRFVQIPAYRAYFNPLVNLGVFKLDGEQPAGDETELETGPERTFEDIELSPLGVELAQTYASAVGQLPVLRQISSASRRCGMDGLKQLGKYGGLCEVAAKTAPDRQLLRDILFCRKGLSDGSHPFRRRSLLLILELCRQLSSRRASLDQTGFAQAVYFGEVELEDGHLTVQVPPCLTDVAVRWRMFHFHYYMGVALEALFSWLVSDLGNAGLKGRSLDQIVSRLGQKSVRSELRTVLGCDLPQALGDLTPAQLFGLFGVPEGKLSSDIATRIDEHITLRSPASESLLERPLWGGEYQQSPTGLAVPMILLALTLGRYKRWEQTAYGDWFAAMARDPYVDLIPPVLLVGVSRRFEDWWNSKFDELTRYVLSRYVIQQHQAMSYEKTVAGDRCLLQVDGSRITCSGTYDRIAVRNVRFHSAVQILMDLGLLEIGDAEGNRQLTPEGRQFLQEELKKEGAA